MFRFILLILLVGLQAPVARADVSPAPILILGDSLSAAYRIAPESGWVNLLHKRMLDKHPPRLVINASISGETTAGGLARIGELLIEHKPGIVVLELGANDALRGLPIATPHKNLSSIIRLAEKAGARVLLVGIEIPVNYGPQYRDGLRTMYRDLAREFNLPLVPFLLEGVALDDQLMQADGLHPTAAAQPRVLENVWPYLESVLDAVRVSGKR